MKVENNKIVSIHYSATDIDGNIVDSNEEFAPLEYLHGNDNILAALEVALDGLTAGQETQVALAPADAYGEYDPTKLMKVSRAVFPVGAEELQPGNIVESPEGEALHFTIKIISIREATPDELQHKHPLTKQNGSCGPDCCC